MLRHLSIFCAFLPFTLLHADDVSLGALGKFTGEIKAVTSEKEIHLQSPVSPELLILQGDQLESLRFDQPQKTGSQTQNLLNLKNGDIIPSDIEFLDAEQLTFRTPWANKLQVSRKAIDSLHFGAGENQVLYSGPKKDEWELSRSWRFDDALVSQGWSPAHRKFDEFPDRYILEFTVAWQGNVGFKCLFNSNSIDGNSNTDCYFIQFNSAGFELKRQSTGAKKYTTLVSINDYTPDNMEDEEMRIEMRVDRVNRHMQLIINGKVMRSNIIDPKETGPAPNGSIVSFTATAGNDDAQTISDIRLTTWASTSSEARLEKRTEFKRDVLFDIESNRSSGTLKSIKAGKVPQILFENPHDPAPKPLPATQVAVIYFSGQSPEKPSTSYRLKLHGGGILHINSFTFSEGIVKAQHPDLGDLGIPSTMIEEVTRTP